MNPAEEDPERYAAARDQIVNLIQEGKAIELMDTYSDCNQSCAYVYDVLLHVANSDTETICNGARNLARNLLDDWSK